MDYENQKKIEVTSEMESLAADYGFYFYSVASYPRDGRFHQLKSYPTSLPFKITMNLDSIYFNDDQTNMANHWFVMPVQSMPNYYNLKKYCKNFKNLEQAIQYTLRISKELLEKEIKMCQNKIDKIKEVESG